MIKNEHLSRHILSLIAGDAIALIAALTAALALRYYPDDITPQIAHHALPFAIVFLFWILVFGAFGLYDLRFLKNEGAFVQRLIHALIVGTIAAILFFYFIPVFEIEPRRNLLIIVGFATIFLILWRSAYNVGMGTLRASGVLFLDLNREAASLIDYIRKNPQLGQKPVGIIADSVPHTDVEPALPAYRLDRLLEAIQETAADTIVITREAKEDDRTVRALFNVIPLGVAVVEFPAYHEMLTGKIPLSLLHEAWFLENLIGRSNPRYDFKKRVFDIALACLIGMIGLAFFPFIAMAIILSAPRDAFRYRERRAREGDGIVLFRQPRVGKNGRVFDFIKFRSMVLGAERMGAFKGSRGDSRHYAVGKFLRARYLDELPQLWNVVRGEMSFVGPRPERTEYVEALKNRVPFYEMRLLALPGITGWAQINMENDASVEDAPEKMQYDLYYIKNRSMGLDLLILLRTFFTVIQRRGR